MTGDYSHMLAWAILPRQILDYFTITEVKETATEIHISLDEKMHTGYATPLVDDLY